MQSKLNAKEVLVKSVWNKKSHYYDMGELSTENYKKQYTFQLFNKMQIKPKSVLDFGCGNGNTLSCLMDTLPSLKQATGFDISSLAIKKAQKKYPKYSFSVKDAENATYSKKFDLVCSFYTFEHLDNPEKVLAQMASLVSQNGYLYIICPNYGSPIYSSPVFVGNFFLRIFQGLARDLLLLLNTPIDSFIWRHVKPQIDMSDKHTFDHDTTIEPYIFSAQKYLEQQYPNFTILHADSGWSTVRKPEFSWKFIIATLPFQLMNLLHILPFRYWGPIHVLLAQKNSA